MDYIVLKSLCCIILFHINLYTFLEPFIHIWKPSPRSNLRSAKPVCRHPEHYCNRCQMKKFQPHCSCLNLACLQRSSRTSWAHVQSIFLGSTRTELRLFNDPQWPPATSPIRLTAFTCQDLVKDDFHQMRTVGNVLFSLAPCSARQNIRSSTWVNIQTGWCNEACHYDIIGQFEGLIVE